MPQGAPPPPEGRPPSLALLDLITGKWVAQALAVAARLGVADMLADGPKPCDELARANQVDAGALHRLLRALASVGVFAEVGEGQFALTPMAELLRTDVFGSLRAMAMMMGEAWSWAAWGEMYRSVKTGETAFEHVFGMGLFDYLARHPAEARTFDEAMTGWSTQTARAIVASYDFAGISTLADVGGGHGALLGTILRAHPEMRGILFDAPAVVEGTTGRLEAVGLLDRCRVVGGDFFATVPEGADAYVLCHIIHDWDDARAVAILANCRRALAPGGKVLLMEIVIPPGNTPSLGKLLDLEMLVVAGGRERTEAEYGSLLAEAGLRLARIVPTPSPLSLIEAVAA
jgi:SAM-dependent methyltransferase